MSEQHTPGPWKYSADGPCDDWGIVRAPVTEQGRLVGPIICQARDPEASDSLTLAKHREAGTDPWEANARLIAAAPEMLEALGWLARDADQWSGQIEPPLPALAKAWAAIAKARGVA